MSDRREAGPAGIRLRFPGIDDPAEVDCSRLPMFRGGVRSRTVAEAATDGGLTVLATRFDAGASTVWHIHDSDQTLVVVDGGGALEDDHGVLAMRPGDVVVVPGGRRHRHLAAADSSMTHVSVTARGEHHLEPDEAGD
ncbi:cupin domain-containing protein [Pseudonocardia acidicola]|uniref:Cupin domain-containing protein n=1 Tax=Pseudonocardia acidicola TaxID=2724939 RepID=A0ABX1S7E7_9PSEU|nr:cupin domain-containing protein [Pseudonocardia acidicola]NMH96522.1 cupin domain-containing protein [Pseudonocardia acidicola]